MTYCLVSGRKIAFIVPNAHWYSAVDLLKILAADLSVWRSFAILSSLALIRFYFQLLALPHPEFFGEQGKSTGTDCRGSFHPQGGWMSLRPFSSASCPPDVLDFPSTWKLKLSTISSGWRMLLSCDHLMLLKGGAVFTSPCFLNRLRLRPFWELGTAGLKVVKFGELYPKT